MFTFFTKREIMHFHVVVVQWRQRNVRFAHLNLLLSNRSRWRRRRSLIGTLRSEDGDGRENVAEKVISRSFNLHHD